MLASTGADAVTDDALLINYALRTGVYMRPQAALILAEATVPELTDSLSTYYGAPLLTDAAVEALLVQQPFIALETDDETDMQPPSPQPQRRSMRLIGQAAPASAYASARRLLIELRNCSPPAPNRVNRARSRSRSEDDHSDGGPPESNQTGAYVVALIRKGDASRSLFVRGSIQSAIDLCESRLRLCSLHVIHSLCLIYVSAPADIYTTLLIYIRMYWTLTEAQRSILAVACIRCRARISLSFEGPFVSNIGNCAQLVRCTACALTLAQRSLFHARAARFACSRTACAIR
jgi:hypothetical protein